MQRDADKPAGNSNSNFRAVRSYVLREGRLTKGQRRALEDLWPAYGLDLPSAAKDGEKLNLKQTFGRAAPTCLEIGFGDGGALVEMAEKNPHRNFLGAEVHRPGVGRLLLQLQARGINNVRIFCEDGIRVLTDAIAENTLQAIYLYFPDPWPKKKHHKRRLLQPPFIHLAATRLHPGGHLHFATDWRPYADQALAYLEQSPLLTNPAGPHHFPPRPNERPKTKFEHRGEKLGFRVWDIVMRRVG